MPGMQTQLNAVIDRPGDYEGFSANYSGAGFSGMKFRFRGLSAAGFAQWVQEARAAGAELSNERYRELSRPSEREPVRRFSGVAAGLYDAILNQCVTSCQGTSN
jgi:cytochrome o ubiquinol oxidase subunit II